MYRGILKSRPADSEKRLMRSEEKFNMLFEFSPIGMALVDHETGAFLEINHSLLNSTGYTKEEFLGLSYWDITPSEYEAQEIQQIEDLNTKGFFGPNEKEYIRKNGTRYPIRIQGFILTDVDENKVVWGIIEDISEVKALENELRAQATRDYLTGAYNRRFFEEMLYQATHCAKRTNLGLSVIMLDIDHFKRVNDEFGHLVGDGVLVQMTEIIKNYIRESDILCRWGGEEFIIMLPNTLLESAYHLAEKLRILISQTVFDGELNITCSFGVASIYDNETVSSLIERADVALYEAKRNHRNCAVISKSTNCS